MPSNLHEVLIKLFRDETRLAPELLRDVFHAELPPYTDVHTEESTLTQLMPTEYHADLVIDMHEALRIGGPKVPLSSLSPKAQKIVRDLKRGIEPTGVHTRAIAEEVATQFRHYVDTTGWPMTRIKTLLRKATDETLHWDDVFGEDGFLLRHAPSNPHSTIPHLQLHRYEDGTRKVYRVFFNEDRS